MSVLKMMNITLLFLLSQKADFFLKVVVSISCGHFAIPLYVKLLLLLKSSESLSQFVFKSSSWNPSYKLIYDHLFLFAGTP